MKAPTCSTERQSERGGQSAEPVKTSGGVSPWWPKQIHHGRFCRLLLLKPLAVAALKLAWLPSNGFCSAARRGRFLQRMPSARARQASRNQPETGRVQPEASSGSPSGTPRTHLLYIEGAEPLRTESNLSTSATVAFGGGPRRLPLVGRFEPQLISVGRGCYLPGLAIQETLCRMSEYQGKKRGNRNDCVQAHDF